MGIISCPEVMKYHVLPEPLTGESFRFFPFNRTICTMAVHTILLFGDQNIDILPAIRRLFRISRRSTTLQKFLRDTADVIQLQVAELSASYRTRFYNFNTLLDLAERVQSLEIPDPLPATILIFAIRLGELIL